MLKVHQATRARQQEEGPQLERRTHMLVDESTYENVPVPTELVPEVYAFISERMGTAGEGPPPEPGLPTPMEAPPDEDSWDLGKNGRWTQTDLTDLRERFQNRSGRAMVTAIAERSPNGEQTSYEDLRSAGEAVRTDGFTYNQVRAQLGWLAKYAKAIKGANVWPISFEDRAKRGDRDLPKGERYWYGMEPGIAEWWLARNDEEPD